MQTNEILQSDRRTESHSYSRPELYLPATRRRHRPARSGTTERVRSEEDQSVSERNAQGGKRTMSAEGRAKIAAAQKARWAAQKKTDQPTAKKIATPAKKSRAETSKEEVGSSQESCRVSGGVTDRNVDSGRNLNRSQKLELSTHPAAVPRRLCR